MLEVEKFDYIERNSVIDRSSLSNISIRRDHFDRQSSRGSNKVIMVYTLITLNLIMILI